MSVETGEFLAMVRRMIRAAGKRVGEADEVELGDLIAIGRDLDEAIATAVAGQRELGKSWAMIATATGTSKQAAHARWGDRRAG